MSRVRVPEGVPNGPLVKRLRRRPLTPQTGVRFSYGSPNIPVDAGIIVGVDDGEGPPVPIPNTVVKLAGAEDTCLETDRENREMPTQKSRI